MDALVGKSTTLRELFPTGPYTARRPGPNMGHVESFDPDSTITVVSVRSRERRRIDVWFIDVTNEVWKVTLHHVSKHQLVI